MGHVIKNIAATNKYLIICTTAFVVTSYIRFFLVVVNAGINDEFIGIWLRSWFIAFVLAIPSLLFVAPTIQKHFQTPKKEP